MVWNWQKRMYLWYCAAAYASFLLVFIGVVSSSWASGSPGDGQWGLLARCTHDYRTTMHDCEAYQFGKMPVWFDVSRTLAGLSVILLFSLTPVSCYLHYHDDRREDVLLLTAFGLLTALIGLIGAILYATLRDTDQGTLSWGFAVFISGHVTAMAAFLTLCCLHTCQPKRRLAPSRLPQIDFSPR